MNANKKVVVAPNSDADTKALVLNTSGEDKETAIIELDQDKLPIVYLCNRVSEEQKDKNNCLNLKIKAALSFFIIAIPLISLISMSIHMDHNNKRHLSQMVGIALWIMYIIYFSIIFYLVFSGSNYCRKNKKKSLYRIYSHSGIVPNWANLSISGYQELYLNQAIQSISEMSAIDGGIPNLMLAYLGAVTWTAFVCVFGAMLYYENGFAWDASKICEVIGCTGLVIIGIFELDPYSVWMGRIHDFGAFLGTGTLIGYILQQNSIDGNMFHGYLPTVTGVIGFVWWTWSKHQTAKFCEQYKYISKHEIDTISDQITKFSITNVVSEALFLFSGATALCWWLIAYPSTCEMGCYHPN